LNKLGFEALLEEILSKSLPSVGWTALTNYNRQDDSNSG
jgi:hypothetical protein